MAIDDEERKTEIMHQLEQIQAEKRLYGTFYKLGLNKYYFYSKEEDYNLPVILDEDYE